MPKSVSPVGSPQPYALVNVVDDDAPTHSRAPVTPPPRLRLSDGPEAATASMSSAQLWWRLRAILLVVLLEMVAAVMFLSTMPNVIGTFFAQPHYHGKVRLDCATEYPEHSAEADACSFGISKAASMSGYSNACQSFTTFLFAPLVGVLSDRYGRRRFFIVSQVLALVPTVFLVLFVWQPTRGMYLWLYYGFNVLNGAVSTVALGLAFVADLVGIGHRAQGFGLVMAAYGLGVMVGPALGGFLPVKAAGFAAIAVCVATVLLAIFTVPETLRVQLNPQAKVSANPFAPMKILTLTSLFRRLSAAVFCSSFGDSGQLALVFYYLAGPYHFGKQQTSVVVIIVGVCGFFTQGFLMKPLTKCGGTKGVLLLGLTTSVVNVALWGIGTLLPHMYGRLLVYVIVAVVSPFAFLSFPAFSAIKSNNVSDSHQGQVQGALYGVRSLAQAAAQLSIPALYHAIPDKAVIPMLVASAVVAIALLISVTLPRGTKSGVVLEEVAASTPMLFDTTSDDNAKPGGPGGKGHPNSPLLTSTIAPYTT